MNYDTQKEIALRDIIRVIFRHKLIILLCYLAIIPSVYINLAMRVPSYRAEVRMLVTGTMQKDVDVQRSLGPGSLLFTQMSLVKSRPILERTVEALKLYERSLDHNYRNASKIKRNLMDRNISEEKRKLEEMAPEQRRAYLVNKAVGELSSRISLSIVPDTSIFNINVTDNNPRMAGVIANVLSRSFVIFDLEQQIASLHLIYGNKNETIIKLQHHIERMQETLDGRRLSEIEALGPATVKIINQAGPGYKIPSRPTRGSALISAFIVSMVLGVTLAFIFDFFDMTFRSSNDVLKYLNVPYLGSIPKRKESEKLLIYDDNTTSKYSMLFQSLSHKIFLLMKEHNSKTLLLADAEDSEETAVIAANIGNCLAHKSGYKVLIIDADLRNPSLHKKFNVSNAQGLADIILNASPLANVVHNLGSNLHFLSAGETSSNPMILLESEEISDIFKETRELYEIVLVNCSDIRHFTDAIILSSYMDSVMFSVNEGKVRRQVMQNAIDPFKQKDIQIIGAMLNNYKYTIPEIIYRLT